ncbi:partner and localizer of BRCA2 isoform X1 [Tiliqua scincoides]|uniref:partner and localizer of BRCA2 isoform X1 n=1 Tax=Tiliqua scincoides TaxID=71010 RepID=UPI0034622FDD
MCVRTRASERVDPARSARGVRPRPGMETLQGKTLTQQEKEELKEQLAFLKREYSKTFHRLQRAERAERVKNHVKKRTAEPNEFLPQKEAQKDPEESISQTSPETTEQVLARAFLEPSNVKATFVGLEPEVVVRGDGLPENSGSECSTPDPESELFCSSGPRPERKQNRLSRSRTKARQRATLALGRRGESACDVLQENAGHDWGCEMASTGSSGSPVFKKRCSTLEFDQSTPSAVSATEGGSHGAVVVQPETAGENVCLGASNLLSDTWLNENRVPSVNSQGKESVFANPEGSAVEKPVACDDVRCWEQVSVQVEKEQVWVGEEEPGRAAGVVRASEAFQGGGTAPRVSGHETLEDRNQCDKAKNLDLDDKEISSLSKAGEMGLGSQGEAGPPLSEEALPAAATESPLSSCTVVEGLLFPVEYYVRTTRRMSRCQQEVDLAAVLQGQLGRRRRGQGASRKERGTNLGLLSREPAGSEDQLGTTPFPAPGACVGPGCDTTSPLQPPPLCGALGQGLIQHRRGRRPRGSAERRAVPGALPELPTPEDSCCLGSCEARGQGAALSVEDSGSQEAQQAELVLAAGRHPEAKLEGVRSSCTMSGTESAISHVRDQEVSSTETPCPERRAQEQEGPWSSSGDELVALDAAPLPRCGKRSSLRMGSQSHPEPLNAKSEIASQKDLPSLLHLQKCGDECGLPETCAIEELEVFDSAQSVESLQCAGPGDRSATGNLCSVSLKEEPARSPSAQQPLHRKGFPSHELLLSPAPEAVTSQLESQLPTSVFPLVGATPVSQLLPGASPLQVKANQSESEDGTRWRPREAAGVVLEVSQSSVGQSVEHCKESPTQIETVVEHAVEALQDSPREWNLQMTAVLKASSSSCLVDLSAVWWEAADSAEFCIAVACEASVSLWRCLEAGRWEVLNTWRFAEVPVSQIVTLPDVHSILCVALGRWETAQIRFLFQSEDGSPEQSQVKVGDIKAILGLKNRRLVVSFGSLPNQTVEVIFFSEAGRSLKRQSLKPPQENISTFAEVDGIQDALVGLTAANCVVVWNLSTGQLLRRIPVGQPDPACVCHKAFSDSGLLFVVLSQLHTEESKAGRTAAFQVIALNPKTARSSGVALLSLPRGIAGRCVEGHVRGTSAAAVLTSGTIAVWDLLLGQCTALLPPSGEGSWSLVRWSTVDNCLLARRTDGSVYLYSYTARLPCP